MGLFQDFLNCHTFVGVRPDLDEQCIVLDVVTHAQHPMGHVLREPEAQLIRIRRLGLPVEVWPVGVGDEGLDDVDGAVPVRVLVEQGEGDGVLEGPLEDVVILPR